MCPPESPAADPRHLGAQPGMLGVLHTWGRDLCYHPHVHYLVPGGGINKTGKWCWTSYEEFFLPVRALSRIFRAKFRDGMKNLGLHDAVPEEVWKKDWVVHCEFAGRGPEAIRYLSRYIYRVAITNSRIISLHDDRVTFKYQPVGTKEWKLMTLPVLVFMARFLQHVLPKGFCKGAVLRIPAPEMFGKADGPAGAARPASPAAPCPETGNLLLLALRHGSRTGVLILQRMRAPPCAA